MSNDFRGWEEVAQHLRERVQAQNNVKITKGAAVARLNQGQCASLSAIAKRIPQNGVILADEVGMGKTRIAVEVARSVIAEGGRVALLVPPGLGFQWRSELREGGIEDVSPLLRSLNGFVEPLREGQNPWFEMEVVMVSHSFANWRLAGSHSIWRWAFVPELFARWYKRKFQRFPRGYKKWTEANGCQEAAESIFKAIVNNRKHPIQKCLDILSQKLSFPQFLDPANYSEEGCSENCWNAVSALVWVHSI